MLSLSTLLTFQEQFMMTFSFRSPWHRSHSTQKKWPVHLAKTDQPGPTSSMIRAFAVHFMGCWEPKPGSGRQWRLWYPGWSESSLGAQVILLVSSSSLARFVPLRSPWHFSNIITYYCLEVNKNLKRFGIKFCMSSCPIIPYGLTAEVFRSGRVFSLYFMLWFY